MRISCTQDSTAMAVLDVLQRHGVTAGPWWEGQSPLDERMWIHVSAAPDVAEEREIQRDVEAIAGATVED